MQKLDFSEKYEILKKILKNIDGKILIFSHYDFDGISSAIVFSEILEKYDLKYKKDFDVHFARDNEHKILDTENKTSFDKYKYIFFLDYSLTNYDYLKDKTIFVIDHHKVNNNIDNIINPALYIESRYLPSNSAIVYDFYYYLFNENLFLKKIAGLGAISDFMIFGSLPYLHTNDKDLDFFMNNSELIKPMALEITQLEEKIYNQKGLEINIFEKLFLKKDIKEILYFTDDEINLIIKIKEKELKKTYKYLQKLNIDENKKLLILELEFEDKELKKYLLNVLEFLYSDYIKIIYMRSNHLCSINLRSPNLDLTKLLESLKKDFPNLNGGGHPFASGCALPNEQVELFLKKIQELIYKS